MRWKQALGRCVVLFRAAVVGFCLVPSTAEAGINSPTPPGLAYLRDEPASMLDLGFFRLQRDLDQAVAPLVDPEFDAQPPRTGVFFSWRDDTIHAFATFPVVPERRTASACITRFLAVTGTLLGGGPDGPERALGYLSRVFSHAGPPHWNATAPRSLAADLARALTLSVTLTGPAIDQRAGDLHTVQCSGPLDADATALVLRESGK